MPSQLQDQAAVGMMDLEMRKYSLKLTHGSRVKVNIVAMMVMVAHSDKIWTED